MCMNGVKMSHKILVHVTAFYIAAIFIIFVNKNAFAKNISKVQSWMGEFKLKSCTHWFTYKIGRSLSLKIAMINLINQNDKKRLTSV